MERHHGFIDDWIWRVILGLFYVGLGVAAFYECYKGVW